MPPTPATVSAVSPLRRRQPAPGSGPGRPGSSRRLLIVPLVVAAVLVWAVVPAFAAAGLALDHPAWSAPDVDPPAGPLTADEPSLWPPGHRYRWTGQNSGEAIERVDPWGSPTAGHLWTAGVTAATGALAWWLWSGARPLLPRGPDLHRWGQIS